MFTVPLACVETSRCLYTRRTFSVFAFIRKTITASGIQTTCVGSTAQRVSRITSQCAGEENFLGTFASSRKSRLPRQRPQRDARSSKQRAHIRLGGYFVLFFSSLISTYTSRLRGLSRILSALWIFFCGFSVSRFCLCALRELSRCFI